MSVGTSIPATSWTLRKDRSRPIAAAAAALAGSERGIGEHHGAEIGQPAAQREEAVVVRPAAVHENHDRALLGLGRADRLVDPCRVKDPTVSAG
jgi:hypothetical protein